MTKKAAIVTGGGRGIGRAISMELATNGYYVIINYKANEAAAKETLEVIRQADGDGNIFAFDISDSSATQKAMAEITKQFEIEILVNNAGINADGLFIMMQEKDWHSVLDTALNGFYNVTRPVLKQMIRKKKGSIVSIASVAGLMGNRGQANYSAAKAGVIAASKSVSSEVARLGIRVNVVAPGLIQTEMIKDAPVEIIKKMIPMARIGKPEEVASVVKFLCSEDAAYVTGQVICVDGGMI